MPGPGRDEARRARRNPARGRFQRASVDLYDVFDSLSDRLTATLGDLRGRGRLTEDDIARAMREIRLALLEADVNFRVVKDFVATVRERAAGTEVLESLTPGQQVVKIVLRGADRADGRGQREARVRAAAADGPHDVRPAGLRQNDDDRQAGADAASRARSPRWSPATCSARRPSTSCTTSASSSTCRSTTRARTRTRSPSPRGRAAGEQAGARRRDPRHRRPAAHRRRADGRARARDRCRSSRAEHAAGRRRA